jgi:hypothetical protein
MRDTDIVESQYDSRTIIDEFTIFPDEDTRQRWEEDIGRMKAERKEEEKRKRQSTRVKVT